MKTRLRELAPAARGSQDLGSRNLVFTFQLSTVHIVVEIVNNYPTFDHLANLLCADLLAEKANSRSAVLSNDMPN